MTQDEIAGIVALIIIAIPFSFIFCFTKYNQAKQNKAKYSENPIYGRIAAKCMVCGKEHETRASEATENIKAKSIHSFNCEFCGASLIEVFSNHPYLKRLSKEEQYKAEMKKLAEEYNEFLIKKL